MGSCAVWVGLGFFGAASLFLAICAARMLPARQAGRVWRLGPWVVLMLTLASCGPELIDLDLRGSVTDEVTGEPIAGAPLILLWSHGFADLDAVGTESGADGGYRLFVHRFPCDAPTLMAGLDPYEAETADVKCVETEQILNFALGRGGAY